MGVTETTRLPAGWYPDPNGGQRRRWWDGREWTQYTAEFQRSISIDEPEADAPASAAKTARANRSTRAAKPARPVKTTKPAKTTKPPADKVAKSSVASKTADAPAVSISAALARSARSARPVKSEASAAAKQERKTRASTKSVAAPAPLQDHPLRQRSAQRLGWLLAGAAHSLPWRRHKSHGRRARRDNSQ